MNMPAQSVRVFFAGNSGSGKTTLAERMYLAKMPRSIIIDLTGEWSGKVSVSTYSLGECVDAIRSNAKRSHQWRVAVSISPAELPGLVQYLIPVPDVRASPVLALGGCAILVDEVDLLAPPGTAKEDVRTLYRRSRHVGLSVISTTQRPANVSREVSAQSTHAVALTLNEARDVDYIARLMRWDGTEVSRWEQWTRQHPHGAVWRNLQTGFQLWIPEKGKPSKTGPRAPQISLSLNPQRAGNDDADDDGEERPAKLSKVR